MRKQIVAKVIAEISEHLILGIADMVMDYLIESSHINICSPESDRIIGQSDLAFLEDTIMYQRECFIGACVGNSVYFAKLLWNESNCRCLIMAPEFADVHINIIKEIFMVQDELASNIMESAAKCGRIDIMELAFERGVDINHGLAAAAHAKNVDSVKWLFNHGATGITQHSIETVPLIWLAIMYKKFVESAETYNIDIWKAARRGDIQAMELALLQGANIGYAKAGALEGMNRTSVDWLFNESDISSFITDACYYMSLIEEKDLTDAQSEWIRKLNDELI